MPCSIPQSLDEVLTPSRKRRRDSDILGAKSTINGLTNPGFSSTPRKSVTFSTTYGRSAEQSIGIIGTNPFINNGMCMEVKSIAEIASEKTDNENNPFEVIRKPPKKKKKADIEDACFENPALNLDGPEKRFNPFEVARDLTQPNQDNCFVNTALNIKSPENAVVNPYEITRSLEPTIENISEGIENPALEDPPPLAITLPFTPRLGCRIDFTGVSLDSLTPSKLLAEKLVFSPQPNTLRGSTIKKSFRRSLSVISEEAVDIGKELDCYQLELENSINEAKLKKNGLNSTFHTQTPEVARSEPLEFCNKSSVSINITNISITLEETSPASVSTPPVVDVTKVTDEMSDAGDISFDDDIDFKAPAPFVRSYRKPDLPRTLSTEIENANDVSKGSTKSSDSGKESKHKFTDLIRKSIRRIVNPHYDSKKEAKAAAAEQHPSSEPNFVMSSIRRSLRRKNHKREVNQENENIDPKMVENDKQDLSIIDTADKRKVFKFTATDEAVNQGLIGKDSKQSSLRKSLRRSTRDIRNHVLKKVFHKNVEEYEMKD